MTSTSRRLTVLLACTTASAALLAAPVAAQAAPSGAVASTLVVETQFWDAPSPVLSASGLFAGCTEVDSVFQAPTRAPQFNGRKHVRCAGGTVDLVYQAAFRDGGVTGTWTAAAGTGSLAGVRGTGTVSGSGDCEVAEGSGGCVLDTWTGALVIAPA
jgi:hypothetical protein